MLNRELNKILPHPDHRRPEIFRLFYALLPDEKTIAKLQQWQNHVSGKKIPAANLHMTLFFLGNQPLKNLPAFIRFLDRTTFRPFDIELDKIGYFPKIGLSWIGPTTVPFSLRKLFEDTYRFLIPTYLKDKSEDFRPHITLARRSSITEIKVDAPVVWTVNRIVLMQSVLNHDPGKHPEYRILHEKRVL